ncbi:PP2C family protein-serine/threonine phosphatase [Segeticoccus rhizosphaerae]|jgi:hypothetical protein|uniref:PP2C family protein-serine/threonine phosphatase n=1 Tax=Segeticoccus rhizosphaerae TaxID=1104777 RepID=UPI001264C170|nr:PP2C family protein-serine/threonine phosphatase [Segeticoccus rhizosphaerae]
MTFGTRQRVVSRLRRHEHVWISTTLVLIALAATWGITRWPAVVPWSSFVPLAVVAGLFLPLGMIRRVYLVLVACFTVAAVLKLHDKESLWGSMVILLVVMALMVTVARSRARLGVQGSLGESMLVDLRDRLQAHGELPDLPTGWYAESSVMPAHGDSFSGDFVVANRTRDNRLEVALVDVSGKGVGAGTRSLLLSGAFAGLLGAMAPTEFLPAANDYLLRQRWHEGFATAIHFAVELDTGDYCIGSAGHPQAVRYHVGSGRWDVVDEGRGPVLGVMETSAFPRVMGRMERGDALLLYTDGVIERRDLDLSIGVDRMLGAAERQIARGFEGAAHRICATSAAGEDDDRAVIMIWRR